MGNAISPAEPVAPDSDTSKMQCAFSVVGPKKWNDLRLNLRSSRHSGLDVPFASIRKLVFTTGDSRGAAKSRSSWCGAI